MEGLKKNLKNLTSILDRLDRRLKKLDQVRKNSPDDEEEIMGQCESAIKRFELSFGLFWKTLKEYLDVHHAISVASPKKAILEAQSQGIISKNEAAQLLAMVDTRNAATHDYSQNMAEDISKTLPAFHKLMVSIIKRIES